MSETKTKKAWKAPAVTTLGVERTLSGNFTFCAEGVRTGFFDNNGNELVGLNGPNSCS